MTLAINKLLVSDAVYKEKWALYFILLGIYFYVISFGFGPYITDDHAFRQTQTAITAYYLNGVQDIYNYQTPVLGLPWSIPFEFPLYQAITKGISEISDTNLVLIGRLVSVMFFLLCFWPIARILDFLQVKNKLPAVGITLLTPLYVFWSRSFMIESTALFFALLYASQVSNLTASPKLKPMALASLFVIGSTAGLVKVTTFAPLFGIACAYLTYRLFQRRAERSEVCRVVALLATHAMIFLVAVLWVRHTDAIKILNPIGALLTSDNLRSWNFGEIEQRFDWYIWFRLLNNTADIYFPLPRSQFIFKGMGSIILTGIFLYMFRLCNGLRRRQVLILIFLFLLPFLVFTNLHRIHSYYQCANAVFLSLAIGVATTGALEVAHGKQRKLIVALCLLMMTLFIVSSIHYFSFKSSESYKDRELAVYLRSHTLRNSVILVSGRDYSSEIPFYTERRALMLPNSRLFLTESLEAGIRRLINSSEIVGAYVECGMDPTGQLVRKYISLAEAPDFSANGCRAFLLK